MQPGYPGSGQDPYGQQQPYQDPYSQPQYSPQSQQPSAADPTGQPPPAPQYPDPAGQPTSGSPYPAYPVAGYGAPTGGPTQQNTLGLIGMVVGIISIPLACCAVLGLIAGIAGLVLGILGMRKVRAGAASNRGMALAGVICGSIGIALSIVNGIAGVFLHFHGFPTAP
jgi:hypothetical protein